MSSSQFLLSHLLKKVHLEMMLSSEFMPGNFFAIPLPIPNFCSKMMPNNKSMKILNNSNSKVGKSTAKLFNFAIFATKYSEGNFGGFSLQCNYVLFSFPSFLWNFNAFLLLQISILLNEKWVSLREVQQHCTKFELNLNIQISVMALAINQDL